MHEDLRRRLSVREDGYKQGTFGVHEGDVS